MASASGPAGMASERFQGLERTGFGFRVLQKQGWTEGKGLVRRARSGPRARTGVPRPACV